MKVTYILTWEEYAEQYRDSWPRFDLFSVIVTAMVAVPMFGYGITLAILRMPDEVLLDSMFIGLPLFLVVAAVFTAKSQSGAAMKNAITEKRLEYDRWHAKEQSFFFDREKWTHETEAGKQESPWSALLCAQELPSILCLLGKNSWVRVPKRVLDSSTLTLLRQTAIPMRGDGWPFQISWWDDQASQTVMLWRKNWFLLTFGNVFGFVVIGWVVQSWFTSNEKAGVIWGWILALFAVILGLTAQFWYAPLRYFTSAKSWRAPQRVEISDRGVCFATPHGDSFTAWKTFRQFQEISRAFLVCIDDSYYHLLSKRYFSAEQQSELRQMLQEKLKGK